MKEKLYVFFTFAIFGIGGTQIYLRNKINFLRKKGWEICVVTAEEGTNIIIEELGIYTKGVFPKLVYNPNLFSKKERDKILDNIISYIKGFGNCDNVVIESSFIAITPWGELIAERLKAKHFIFFIQEDYHFKVESYRNFFSFKLDRGELAANSHMALPTLFDGHREIPDGRLLKLSAYCSNSVEDCESKISSSLPAADFYIGSFGRINKPFVQPMIDDLVNYAKSHSDKHFHIVLFGWTSNPNHLQIIEDKISKVDNLSWQSTGSIYPVPKCDIKKMDVFISTSGAAWATYKEGVVTISIDDSDLKPIGILGHTTTNSLHRDKEPVVDLANFLNDTLFEKKYLPEDITSPSAEEIYSPKFEEHLNYLNRSTSKVEYYPIALLKPKFLSKIYFRLREKLLLNQ